MDNRQEATANPDSKAGKGPAGTPDPTALPKGGGAVRSIGEKFSVNAATGAGTLLVPIFTSPGRQGFSPKLSIAYNSGAGNGPFALGWHLSFPQVSRRTEKGMPRYIDAADATVPGTTEFRDSARGPDTFVLSEAEDLVPFLTLQNGEWAPASRPDATADGSTFTVTRYRPRIESGFARIERWQRDHDKDIHWRARTTDNVTSVYGQAATARIADPEDPTHVFKWLPDYTFDDRGNVLYYQYKAEDSTGIDPAAATERNRLNGNAPFTNTYCKRILYANQHPYTPGEDLTLRTDWLMETVFDYGEHDPVHPTPAEEVGRKWATRVDPFSTFRSGFEVRTYRLCQRVLQFHHFPGEGNYDGLVAATSFIYDPNPVATRLLSVLVTGYTPDPATNTYGSSSLPPLEFTYSEARPDKTVYSVTDAELANAPAGLTDPLQWIDLDGEGAAGIYYQSRAGAYYKRNSSPANLAPAGDILRASPRFTAQEALLLQPGLAIDNSHPRFMDFQGDGHQDMVDLKGPARGFYRRTTNEGEGWEPFRAFDSFPNLDTNNPNLRFIDIDGDGLTDILLAEDEFLSYHLSLGKHGFAQREFARKPREEEKGPALLFADPTASIFVADMTGDGLTDIVRIRNGEVSYWPNRGYGRFGARVCMDKAPLFEDRESFDPRRIRLGDIDGSGTSDIIYLRPDGIALYSNQSGNSWSAPMILDTVPAVNNLTSIKAIDLLGNGMVCLVWSSPLPTDAGMPIKYLDLMGGYKPHLLIGIDNNVGAQTRLRYASSTRFYVEDRDAGNPWITRLAFPVYVVERAEVFDFIGRTRLVSTYRYRHGYFDGVEREFRGFGFVEQRDADSFGETGSLFTEDTDTEADALHAPPIVTKTWYHTGAWPDALAVSLQMAAEYFGAPTGSPLPDSPLPVSILLPDQSQLPYSLTGGETREAIRALKGSVLHQEVYADDGSPQAAIPYMVTAHNYSIEIFQPRGENLYAVFYSHPRETMSIQYERNPTDARVTHQLILQVDAFGNTLLSANVAYGRNLIESGLPLAPPAGTTPDPAQDPSLWVQPEQLRSLFTLHEGTLTQPMDTPACYRSPEHVEDRSYELTRPGRPDESVPYTFGELYALATTALPIPFEEDPDPAQTQKRLIGCTRTVYLDDNLQPLPFSQIDTLGLVYKTYTLSLTEPLAERLLVTDNTNPNKPTNAAELATLIEAGGYVHGPLAGGGEDGDWWVPSGQTIFAPDHFFLPQAFIDAFGQYSRSFYDDYDLLVNKTIDALGNTSTALHDYRVLQPKTSQDANGNYSSVAYDHLGMVCGSVVLGKIDGAGHSESGDSFDGFIANPAPADIDNFIQAADPTPLGPALLGNATSRILYDLQRFRQTRAANPDDPTQWEPVFTARLRRETHTNDLAPGDTSQVQLNFTWLDGLGRAIQKKIQAEGGLIDPSTSGAVVQPRWVGSGWVIFDNKNQPIRNYEPFFTPTHRFEFAVKTGVTATNFYDSLGRIVAIVRPDHSWEKTVPHPWHRRAWDVNDTVGTDAKTDPDVGFLVSRLPDADYLPSWYELRTDAAAAAAAWPDAEDRQAEQAGAAKAFAHRDTPSIEIFDSLGRPFLSAAATLAGGTPQYYSSRQELDISGSPLGMRDALGRLVMRADPGPKNQVIHQAGMEDGESRSLVDVGGAPIRGWDARGFMQTTQYDELRRQVAVIIDGNGFTQVLAEKIIYGDSKTGAPADPEAVNLRTRVYQAFDTAGIVTNFGMDPVTGANEGYDYKGNLLRNRRQLAEGGSWRGTVDWNHPPATGETFMASNRFDALDRTIQYTLPHSDNAGTTINYLQPTYNIANYLEAENVWLSQAAEPGAITPPAGATLPVIVNLDYDSKGRRTLAEYGILDNNNQVQVSTTYAYDPRTFRLTRLTTRRKSDNVLLQDLRYYYDPMGNVLHIQDDADIQNTVYFQNKRVEPSADYIYDPLYRLTKAQGREHLGQTGGVPNAPSPSSYNDLPKLRLPSPNDGNAMGLYIENFTYDAAGNLLKCQHVGSNPANPGWTRTYIYNEPSALEPGRVSNRLSATTIGAITETYSTGGDGYDQHGNMLRLPQLPAMTWDYRNMLAITQRQQINADDTDGATHPGERTYYVYNAQGMRVRKITESARGLLIRQRIYLGTTEVYREYDNAGALILERESVMVTDDRGRVAMVETRTLDTAGKDKAPKQMIRYQFDNQLGSACLELTEKAELLSYEEYYPYGSTSYQAVRSQTDTPRRYRYTGKERDWETGLYYHGARYYIPWLAKWSAADPAGIGAGMNLYAYVRGNPITRNDPDGRQDNSFKDLDPTIKELNEHGIKHDLNDTRTHAQPRSTPMTVKEAENIRKSQNRAFRKDTGMTGRANQSGHTATVRDAHESQIQKADWDKAPKQQLNSRRGQDLDVTVTHPDGRVTTNTRHTAQEGLSDQGIARVKAANGGNLSPQGQLDSAEALVKGTENTPLDTRNVNALRASGPVKPNPPKPPAPPAPPAAPPPAAPHPPAPKPSGSGVGSTIEEGLGGAVDSVAKDIKPGTLAKGFIKGAIINYITTKVSVRIIEGNKWADEKRTLDKANHAGPDPKDKKSHDILETIIGWSPMQPHVTVAVAVADRFILDRAYDAVQEDRERRAQKFDEQNPGADPGAQDRLEKAADAYDNGADPF